MGRSGTSTARQGDSDDHGLGVEGLGGHLGLRLDRQCAGRSAGITITCAWSTRRRSGTMRTWTGWNADYIKNDDAGRRWTIPAVAAPEGRCRGNAGARAVGAAGGGPAMVVYPWNKGRHDGGEDRRSWWSWSFASCCRATTSRRTCRSCGEVRYRRWSRRRRTMRAPEPCVDPLTSLMRVDEVTRPSLPEAEKPFLMRWRMCLASRGGAVVTGRIERGKVKVGLDPRSLGLKSLPRW